MGMEEGAEGREVSEIDELRRLLEGHVPKRGGVDRVVWKIDP